MARGGGISQMDMMECLGGWTGRREGGFGWWGDGERGNGEGETGMGKRGGVKVLAKAGSGEGETGRGQQEGEDSKGANGRGRTRGKRRGDFTDGYDEMPRWTYGMPGSNEVTKFSDFVYPCNAGYPS